jgi:hypothetical protein
LVRVSWLDRDKARSVAELVGDKAGEYVWRGSILTYDHDEERVVSPNLRVESLEDGTAIH